MGRRPPALLPEARDRHDLPRADQRHAACAQPWRGAGGRRQGRPLRRFRRRHHRGRAGGSRQIRRRRAGAAQFASATSTASSSTPARSPPRPAGPTPIALDGGGVERGVGPGSVRRPGPAARDQRRLHRNLERVEHRLRPLPAADALRDRGARRPWQRRIEEDLSGETRVRPMDRHHAAHRAAGRLRRRRAAHPRRARARRQLPHQGHENLHHLWRTRHDRQHRAFRARATARCARGHQGHFAVPDSEIPGQCRRLAGRSATTFLPAASSTSSACMPHPPAP